MIEKNKIKSISIFILIAISMVISGFAVAAASFDFDPTPPSSFNLTEDVYWIYDINVTVNESLVNFSMETTPYSNLSLDKDNGILTFTPSNDDVGKGSGPYLIIIRNISDVNDALYRNLYFNISNVNDAPNITSYYPLTENVSMDENTSLEFNVTADDVDIPYGDYLNYSWLLNGVQQAATQKWNYTPGLCDSGNYTVTVIVNDSSNAFDSYYWNVTVNNVNRPPIFNKTINNITWNEDANLTNNFTLDDHFYDLSYLECNGSNKDNLTYNALGNSSIRIVINSTTHNVSFYPPADWYGVEYVNFTLYDGYNTTYSNIVVLNVTAVPDPPVLTSIPNQILYVDIPFSYQVNATDPDNDPLAYYDNTTLFDINSSTGLINFTPNSSQIGVYYVNITVGDSIYNVSQIVIFNVSNNTAPVLDSIGNLNATEGTAFYYDVNASDVDEGDNATLAFYTNVSFFTINPATGIISFTPGQDDVGNHSVKISVNDSKGAVDFEIINFTIFNINNQPNLTLIPNQTTRIDKLFTLYIYATDLDNDPLNFSDNATIFNITNYNATTGLINFTPASIGVHIVNITVTDGSLNDSQLVWFNITENHAPVLNLISNQTPAVNSLFTLYVNATDQDNDPLNFSDNATIFNITNYNATTGLINFTPLNMEVHIINITVSDGNLSDWQLVWFNITGNNAPNITSYYPNITNPSVKEGSSMQFNVTAADSDNNPLTYNWTLNGTTQSTSPSWLYQPNYTAVGNYNVTVFVSDGNLTDSHYWNLTVNNTNRAPKFGVITHTSEANFISGTTKNTNSTLQSGNVTLAMINSTHYYSTGNFTSSIIPLPVDYFNNVSLGNISWSEYEPASTGVVIQARTSPNNNNWTNWSTYVNSSGQQLQNASDRYAQYRAEFSTSDTTTTPVLEEVTISYNIPDVVGEEDSTYNNWIDLDDYFSDDDGDTLTYNVTSVSGISITIDSDNKVDIEPDSNWYGTAYIVFTANDSEAGVSSNNISITLTNVVEPDSPTVIYYPSGGGGGGTTIIKETKLVNKTELATIELVVPQPISVVSNATLVAPILLRNTGNMTLKGIKLDAFVDTSNILLRFSKNYFDELKTGEQKETELYITIQNATGSYDILVKAQVSEPKLNDSALIQVNILENLTQKVNFVRDFLSLHPQCLELTEAIQKAQEALNSMDVEGANVLLDSAIEGCKYLVSASGKQVEAPRQLGANALRRVLANRELTYTIIFILVTTFSLVFYVWYNTRSEI